MEEKKFDAAKDKVNYYAELVLRNYKGDLGFTFKKLTIEYCKYYGPSDYEIEMLFHGFNGGKYPHRCRLYSMYGVKTQTMSLDNGFPSLSVIYDKEQIPDELIEELAKAAYYESKFEGIKESEKNTTK